MTQNIDRPGSSFSKIFSDLKYVNHWLKIFILISSLITLVSLTIAIIEANKEPQIIAINHQGEKLDRNGLPKPETEIRRAIEAYVTRRYRWEPTTIKQTVSESKAFILPTSIREFEKGMANVIQFSEEKKVVQKVYPENIKINLETKTALVTGERITIIQGIRAAGSLRTQLSFEFGPRTELNPWGIYITKELEIH